MALPNITFNRADNALGRALPGKDHFSSLLFYLPSGLALPAGFTVGDEIKKVLSLQDAVNLGILDDHAEETKATGGQVTVTGTWIAGEIVRIEIDGASIGQFVLTTTTITSLVAGLVAAINAGTTGGVAHGWAAVDTDPIITLTQPGKLGLKNDSGTPIVFVDRNATDTGASAGGTSTDVQMSGGVGGYYAIMHYHISEYFRLNPAGELFLGLYSDATAYDGDEIRLIQDFANGDLRQMGILRTDVAYAASQTTTTQADLDTLETDNTPLLVLWHSDFSATTVSALVTLGTLSNERVSVILGEEGDYHEPAYSATKVYKPGDKVTFQGGTYQAKADVPVPSPPGDNAGPFDAIKWTFLRVNLALINGFSISTLGASLGVTSDAQVHQNIGWVEGFPLVTVGDTSLDNVAFATKELWKDVSVSLRNNLNSFSYVFMVNHQGLSGSWHNDSWTAIAQSNDFATIENVRTMDKAVRNVRINILPNLLSPLYVTTEGKLTEDTIAKFKNDSNIALVAMEIAGEVSAFSTTINPDQDVLTTSKLVIAVTIVPVGTAREITYDIGFAVKITS